MIAFLVAACVAIFNSVWFIVAQVVFFGAKVVRFLFEGKDKK